MSEVVVAAIIPSLFALAVLLSLTTVIIVLLCKRQINKGVQNHAQEKVYYSVVGPPLSPPKLERNVAYGEIHTKMDSSTVISEVEKNLA